MNIHRQNRRVAGASMGPWLLRGALCALVIGGTLLGCGWEGPSNSLRFNFWRGDEELYRLPPLPLGADGEVSQPTNEEHDYAAQRRRLEESAAVWAQAEAAESTGDWALLRQALDAFLQGESYCAGLDSQHCRNSATDRLAALQSNSSDAGLRAYLAARRAYDQLQGAGPGTYAERSATPQQELAAQFPAVAQQLAAVPNEPGLRDNVAYLRAALLLLENKPAEAARNFRALAAQYPHSEKREAALFMTAVAQMKASCGFTGRSGDDEHNFSGKPVASEDVPPPCIDAAWHEAQQAFRRYLAAYPAGRYRREATGWRAYLQLRGGDRAQALIGYYRMLADARDQGEALLSLRLTRHHATAEQMQRVEAELADEPATALVYAYHNLYNYAPKLAWDARWEKLEARQEQDKLVQAERQRIVAFANRLLQRYPHTRLSGTFTLRMAQANLELGEHQTARTLAARALSLGLTGAERQQALWIKGAAEQRLNEYAAARVTLNRLIAENNGGGLTEGARRLLAMAAEDAGAYDEALNQYFALGYDSDIAYFVDVRLTPEQLAGFLQRQPRHAQGNQLRYALGVRYLRAGRWAEARATLAQVKTEACNVADSFYTSYYNPRAPKANPKDNQTPENQGICAAWVLRDRQTIDELERLESQAAAAQGDEAKAEALYQFASYQLEGGTMLFYNPAAWRHQRVDLLSWLASSNAFRAPNEARQLFEAAQAHDARARALQIYLDIVRRFPATRAARDALFTAAVCHDRLSDMNGYWRTLYAQGLHAGDRLVKYREVKKTYPDYRLPHGQAWDWEPSTRTVAGQPAWPPLPKPKPPKPLGQRLKRKAERVWQSTCAMLEQVWLTTVRPGLLGVLCAAQIAVFLYMVTVGLLLRRQASADSKAEAAFIKLDLRASAGPGITTTSPVEKIIREDRREDQREDQREEPER